MSTAYFRTRRHTGSMATDSWFLRRKSPFPGKMEKLARPMMFETMEKALSYNGLQPSAF
jgi:hypothetical protein